MNRAREMIVAGTCAATRLSSRLHGSRNNTIFWRPVLLHWRRTPRPRVVHRDNQQAAYWTSIFAPRILLHFSSSLTAVANSILFATTGSILKPLLTQHSIALHHRETLRTHFSHERIFVRSSEPHSKVARVDVVHMTQPRRGADPTSRPRPLSLFCPARSFSITARSNIGTTRISNTFTNHSNHSVSSSMTAAVPSVFPGERTALASRYSAESPRIIQRTELVWRQPQTAAKLDSQEVRRSSVETPPHSRVLTFDSPVLNKTAVKTTPPSAAPAFGAAQMDRFVDNVIGRVEKRLRIERERRGW